MLQSNTPTFSSDSRCPPCGTQWSFIAAHIAATLLPCRGFAVYDYQHGRDVGQHCRSAAAVRTMNRQHGVASMLLCLVTLVSAAAAAQAPRVAVVGAGMAGAYAAYSLAKSHPGEVELVV